MAKELIQSARGMRDIFSPEALAWEQLHQLIHEVLAQFSYLPVQLPLLEKTGLFQRAVGEDTDIVSKEMYTFSDRNNESLTLRPEATAGMVRAMIQHGLLQQQQRVYTEGPMFRYERPQKGRYRQFSQVSVETFGIAGPGLDVELISIGERLFRLLNCREQVTLEINTIGLAEERYAFRRALVDYLQQHTDRLDEDSRRRLSTNPLRILDSKNPDVQAVLDDAPELETFFGENTKAHFARVRELLETLGIVYKHNPRLVRGLDYYCHTVFEWTTDALGAQGTVTAGGRYDGLIHQLGGPDIPAAGFAFGTDRILLLAESTGFFKARYPLAYCIAASEQHLPAVMHLGQQIREQCPHAAVLVQTQVQSLKNQFKKADREKARFALVIGDTEAATTTVTVKDLHTGKQESIALAHISDYLNLKRETI